MKMLFKERIASREAAVGVIGLGYVGLPLILRLVDAGFRALGLDRDSEKVNSINNGQSYIVHIPSSRFDEGLSTRRLRASTDMSLASDLDAILICVPTPLDRYRQPDLSFVTGTVDALLPHLRPGQLVALESTTYPGTTEEELQPRIESTGLLVGRDIFLVYSPEREDPANPAFTISNIPKVCGGVTADCLEVGMALYMELVDKVVPVSSPRTAEMAKLLENIHRAVNIGLVNEMKKVADRMGINIYEVIDAAATKPFGFVPYYPGPGLGGHCIPVDPFYLTWKAREYGVDTKFIELAGEVNRSMPEWVVSKLGDALNEMGKAIHGSRILVLGIAYKKNLDDMRESPAVAMMELLRAKGAELAYADPHVSVFPPMRTHHFDLCSVELTEEIVQSFDCVLLATDHDAFDYEFIRRQSRLIIDTRGVYRDGGSNVVSA